MENVVQIVVRVGSAAHRFGAPTYVLESALPRLTMALGLRGAFMAQPRYLSYAFWQTDEARPQNSAFIDLPPVEYDLDKLSRVMELIASLEGGGLRLGDAAAALQQIEQRPASRPTTLSLAYAAAAAGFAVLLNASWRDVATSAVLGVLVWAVSTWAGRARSLAPRPHRIELIAAFASACAANLIAAAAPSSNASTVALCSFIVLVPGLPLTLGVVELTEGQTLAGMNRLVEGVVSTFSLFAGAAAASVLAAALLDVPPPDAVRTMPAIATWAFVVILMLGLTTVFHALPRDAPWCVGGGVLAFGGVTLGDRLGDWQGPFLGAFILGAYAILIPALTRRLTPLAVALPGVLVLVPGAAAYLTLSGYQPDDPLRSITALAGVLTQIVAIVAGLSTASLVMPTHTLRRLFTAAT